MVAKVRRKVTTNQVMIGDAPKGDGASDRVVVSGKDSVLADLINQPLSKSAADRIERLEAASSRMGRRLGDIRMN